MKTKQDIELTLGDLITAAFQTCGADRAAKIVRLAIGSRAVVFREPQHVLISTSKGWSA